MTFLQMPKGVGYLVYQLQHLKYMKEQKIINILKDIRKFSFNWNCDCKSCNKIKNKIIKLTGEKEQGK